MRFFSRTAGPMLLVATLVSGCGSAPPPVTPQPASSAPPVVSAPPALPSSKPLDMVADGAVVVVRVSGEKLRATKLLLPLRMLAKAGQAGEMLEHVKKACGFDPVDAIDELVVSETDQKQMVFAARTSTDREHVLSCIKSLAGGETSVVGGRDAVVVDGRHVMTFDRGLILGGDPALVEAALAKTDGAPLADPATRLDMSPDAVVSIAASPKQEPIEHVTLTITQTAQKLSLDVLAEAKSPEAAAKLVHHVEEARDHALAEAKGEPSIAPLAQAIASALHVSADGANVRGSLGVTGDTSAQLELLGKIALVGSFGVKQYALHAKSAEARSHLHYLEKRAIAYIEEQSAGGKARKAKFPPSAARTPADVPKGTSVSVPPSSWDNPTWKALAFAPELPLFYAYSVVTSKDGKQMTLRAEGDLDGDGKPSKLESTLTLKPDGSVEIGNGITVVDELE